MESVGQKLREARLRKELALEDVSAATKINLRNLQAIESDDLAQICSPFTYRSFARQFANFVGADWAELDHALAEMSSRIPAPLVPGEAGAPLPPSNIKPKKGSKLRWALSLSSLGLMLGACSMFYGAWQSSRSDVRGSITAFANSFSPRAVTPAQSVNNPPTVTKAQQALVPAAVPSQGKPTDRSAAGSAPAAGEKTFRIELAALEQSWLSVATDGKEVFAGVLQPSQTKVLEGSEEAKIRTGNAGGVEVTINGRSLGTLGRRGEVRTVVFTRNGYEVLEHAAQAHTATLIGE